MSKKPKFLNENEHLELNFKFCSGELAENFRDQVDRPELTKLYGLLADFGAQVECRASLWKDDLSGHPHELDQLLESIRTCSNASEIKRQVSVTLPHDGNLKTLWKNLAKGSAFGDVIEQDSVHVDIGGYDGFVGWIVDPAENNGESLVVPEQPEFLLPVHPPRKKGFTII